MQKLIALLCCFAFVVSPASAEEKKSLAPAVSCGGPDTLSCPEGQFCEYPLGICGKNQSFGTCVPLPEICTMEYRPVCGCDGQTYGNACAAKSKKISVEAEGECKTAR